MSTATAARLLVIEDDPDIAEMLQLNLAEDGHSVVHADRGETGLQLIDEQRVDLLVLDLMLPGIDGFEVCRRVRARAEHVAIIILSARSGESHRVSGLELGADDYLAKPFSMAELSARVRAVLRRLGAARELAATLSGVVRCGVLAADPVSREARLREQPLSLTSKEFDLLLHFMRNPGRAFKRTELLEAVWGTSYAGYEHTVNTHINRLRAKIEVRPAQPRMIVTVFGVGYKMMVAAE